MPSNKVAPANGRTRRPRPGDVNLEMRYFTHAYLHARAWLCPDCTGLTLLDPGSGRLSRWDQSTPKLRLSRKIGWRMNLDKTRMIPEVEIVPLEEAGFGTIARGIATCIFCGFTTAEGAIAAQIRAAGAAGLNAPAVEYCRVKRLGYTYLHPSGKTVTAYVPNRPREFVVSDAQILGAHRVRQQLLGVLGLPDRPMVADPVWELMLREIEKDEADQMTILEMLGIPDADDEEEDEDEDDD